MGTSRMRASFGAVLFAVCISSALAASAWNDFVNFKGPVAAPKDAVAALNLASTRRATATNSYSYSQVISLDAGENPLAVTVNSYIANGTTAEADIKKHLAVLCAAHVNTESVSKSGQVVYGPSATWMNVAKAAADKPTEMPLQCTFCLTKGYGTTEATPGFYLPCGCQNTCVDVSGKTLGNYKEGSLTQTGAPMESCEDYIANGIVSTCGDMAIYHAVLWPSLLSALALIYTAYAMVYMPLDMDSLLYTVGSSSGKKDA